MLPIAFKEEKCPHCNKKIEVTVEYFEDGNDMDEMNTVIKINGDTKCGQVKEK